MYCKLIFPDKQKKYHNEQIILVWLGSYFISFLKRYLNKYQIYNFLMTFVVISRFYIYSKRQWQKSHCKNKVIFMWPILRSKFGPPVQNVLFEVDCGNIKKTKTCCFQTISTDTSCSTIISSPVSKRQTLNTFFQA